MRRGQTRVLTTTRGVAEMEPMTSPDGRWIVFTDWRDGALYRAAVLGTAAP